MLSHPLRKADDSEIARLVATAKTAAESAAKESLRREYVREHAVPDTRDTLVVPPLTENDTFPKYQPPSHTVQQLSASSAATVEVSIGGTATSGGTSGATATTISGSGAALAATAASTAGGATAAVSVGGSEGGGRGKTVTAARLLYEQMQAMHAQLVGEYEDALATNTMTVRRWDLVSDSSVCLPCVVLTFVVSVAFFSSCVVPILHSRILYSNARYVWSSSVPESVCSYLLPLDRKCWSLSLSGRPASYNERFCCSLKTQWYVSLCTSTALLSFCFFAVNCFILFSVVC